MTLKTSGSDYGIDYSQSDTLSSDTLQSWRSSTSGTHVTPTVRDLMITRILTVTAHMTLDEVLVKLIEHNVPTAPVVEKNQNGEELIGFITDKDCLNYLSNEIFYGNPHATAESMMQRFPLCVSPETDIFTISDIFTNHPYRYLPVVKDKQLLGIISRRDVLRGLFEFQKQTINNKSKSKSLLDLRKIVNLRFIMK